MCCEGCPGLRREGDDDVEGAVCEARPALGDGLVLEQHSLRGGDAAAEGERARGAGIVGEGIGRRIGPESKRERTKPALQLWQDTDR